MAASFAEAAQRCYAAVEAIRFEGAHFRRDIGRDAIEALSHKA